MACSSCGNKSKPVSVTKIKENMQPINTNNVNVKVVYKPNEKK